MPVTLHFDSANEHLEITISKNNGYTFHAFEKIPSKDEFSQIPNNSLIIYISIDNSLEYILKTDFTKTLLGSVSVDFTDYESILNALKKANELTEDQINNLYSFLSYQRAEDLTYVLTQLEKQFNQLMKELEKNKLISSDNYSQMDFSDKTLAIINGIKKIKLNLNYKEFASGPRYNYLFINTPNRFSADFYPLISIIKKLFSLIPNPPIDVKTSCWKNFDFNFQAHLFVLESTNQITLNHLVVSAYIVATNKNLLKYIQIRNINHFVLRACTEDEKNYLNTNNINEDNICASFIDFLQKNTSIESLRIECMFMQEESLKELTKLLLNKPCSLTKLRIVDSYFKNERSLINEFLWALNTNTSLKKLTLFVEPLTNHMDLLYPILIQKKGIFSLSIKNYMPFQDNSPYIVNLINENQYLKKLKLKLSDTTNDFEKLHKAMEDNKIYGNLGLFITKSNFSFLSLRNPYLAEEKNKKIDALISKIEKIGHDNKTHWRKKFSSPCESQFESQRNIYFSFK